MAHSRTTTNTNMQSSVRSGADAQEQFDFS